MGNEVKENAERYPARVVHGRVVRGRNQGINQGV